MKKYLNSIEYTMYERSYNMQLQTTKIETGLYKVIVFTDKHHYMFDKTVFASDFTHAEEIVREFIKEMRK